MASPKIFFKYAYYNRRMSTRPVASCNTPTAEDDLFQGVKSLSEQIRSFRAGGLSTGTRQLSDGNYDEDSSLDVDPSSEFGLDRFEKAEAISSTISDRMAKKQKDKLDHAEV